MDSDDVTCPLNVATITFTFSEPVFGFAAAVLSEISDDWETERAYLTMEAR